VVEGFRIFAGRLDYVALALGLLGDRRHAVSAGPLDELIAHVEQRGLRLVDAQARRLRGIQGADAGDLTAALATFDEIGARPFVARVRTELGMLSGDAALVDQGLDELEALGDVEQSARVAAERKARSLAPSA